MSLVNLNYNQRTFIISCNHFQGFKININLEKIDNLTIDNLINIVKKKLKNHLIKFNFEVLLIEFNKKNFHIHNETIETIINRNSDDSIYICTFSTPH